VGVNPSVMGRHGAEVGDVGIGVGFGRATDDLRAVRSRDEGALGVEEFEGVPLDGVVRGGEDDAPVRPFTRHGHLDGGRGGQPQVEDVNPHAHQGTGHQALDHVARGTGIPPDHDEGPRPPFPRGESVQDPASVAHRGAHDIGGRQVVVFGTADGAAEPGDAADEGHAPKVRWAGRQRLRNPQGFPTFIGWHRPYLSSRESFLPGCSKPLPVRPPMAKRRK